MINNKTFSETFIISSDYNRDVYNLLHFTIAEKNSDDVTSKVCEREIKVFIFKDLFFVYTTVTYVTQYE